MEKLWPAWQVVRDPEYNISFSLHYVSVQPCNTDVNNQENSEKILKIHKRSTGPNWDHSSTKELKGDNVWRKIIHVNHCMVSLIKIFEQKDVIIPHYSSFWWHNTICRNLHILYYSGSFFFFLFFFLCDYFICILLVCLFICLTFALILISLCCHTMIKHLFYSIPFYSVPLYSICMYFLWCMLFFFSNTVRLLLNMQERISRARWTTATFLHLQCSGYFYTTHTELQELPRMLRFLLSIAL